MGVLVVLSFIVACGGSSKTMIVKKWQIDDIKSAAIDEMMAKAKDDTTMGGMMAAMMKQMMEAMKNTTMEFTADGKYKSISKMEGKEQTDEGSYELSDDGKKLSTTDKGGKKTEMEVTELSESKLVLKGSEEGKDIQLTLVPAK